VRRFATSVLVGCFAAAVAHAQNVPGPPRATPAGGQNVRPFSTPVDPLARARQALDAGRGADALTALAPLRGRAARSPEALALRAAARFAGMDLPLEPDGARSATAAQRRDLLASAVTLTRWTTAHPDDALVLLTLGRAQLVLNALDLAERAFDGANRARPADARGWNDRAMVLVAQRRLADAEHCLVEATRWADRDPDPWSNLGAVRLARGDARGAAEAFQHAIERSAETARHHSDLGSARLAQGETAGAIRAYQRASELAPADGVILSNLGFSLSLADRLDEAAATLRRAVELAPRSVSAWNNLGAVLARRGERDEARRCFEHALGLDGADPRARANLDAL